VTAALLAAAALVLGRGAPPVPAPLRPVPRAAPSAAEAVAGLLGGAGAGGVVAFGEIHQDAASAAVRSSLARFTDEILPVLAPRTAHLVVETWVARGDCGAAESRVTEDIAKTTERPPETESEIVRLLRRARAAGVQPHILEVPCDEYRALAGGGAGGGVDYDRLLRFTGRALAEAVRKAALAPRPPGRPLVLVYGGALHNDLHPVPELAPYAFGPEIHAFMCGAYREIDLYVPELVDRLPAVRAERWYPAWRRSASRAPGRAMVVPRSARSAIVVFPRSVSSSVPSRAGGSTEAPEK
jgi:hypothetical protein